MRRIGPSPHWSGSNARWTRPRGNCIANLLRLQLDVIGQRAALEELRRLEDEVERMKAAMVALMEQRDQSWR